MLPAILGLGGLTAKIIATAVIPRVVRAISQSFSTTRAPEACPSPPVEGISSGPEPAPAPVLSGVSGTQIRSRKWGYAGLWHHQASGLDLATYRLYDAANKRWISRDPLGEGVDYNVYRYVNNNPIGFVDPLGLKKKCIVYVIYTWVPPSRGDYHTTLYVECFDDGKRTLDRYDFGPTKTGYCGSYGVSDMSGSGPGVGELHRRPDKSPDTSLGKLQNSKNAELHMLPAPPDVNQRFQNASNHIENNHVQYHTLGHNSNSAAEFLLNSAAMRLPAPGPGINVPHTPMMGP